MAELFEILLRKACLTRGGLMPPFFTLSACCAGSKGIPRARVMQGFLN